MNNTNLQVRIERKNKNLQVVSVDEFGLDIYCQLLSNRILKTLDDIENFFNTLNIEYDIDTDVYYRSVRKNILNLAGDVKRISENIIEPVCDLNVSHNTINTECVHKPTVSFIKSLFGGGE